LFIFISLCGTPLYRLRFHRAVAMVSSTPGCRKEDSSQTSKPVSAWTRYASIESVGNAKMLKMMLDSSRDVEWVATEKVHGANFAFETDGETIEYASRSAKLGAGAEFLASNTTMPPYHPLVLKAFEIAKSYYPSIQRLLIYGEYFGGWYPLPGQPHQKKGLRKVQTGIAYSPDHHFYPFDVRLDCGTYLDFDEAKELLASAGFPLLPEPLQRGSLEDLLAIDVESLETTVPDMLGLPPLSEHRIAEGMIIRQAKECWVGDHRPMLKLKSRAFWECTNQVGVGARQAQRIGSSLSALGVASLSGTLEESNSLSTVVDLAKNFLTENRIRAVISKDPDLMQERLQPRLEGLFASDIMEDLKKYHEEEVQAVGKEVKDLKKAVRSIARYFVTSTIVAIRADAGEPAPAPTKTAGYTAPAVATPAVKAQPLVAEPAPKTKKPQEAPKPKAKAAIGKNRFAMLMGDDSDEDEDED